MVVMGCTCPGIEGPDSVKVVAKAKYIIRYIERKRRKKERNLRENRTGGKMHTNGSEFSSGITSSEDKLRLRR